MDPHDHVPILDRCLQRVTRWRLPPKWSRRDWLEEAEAAGQLAACKAEQDYDPASGIDHEAFVYQRVMAGILSRYRTEWVYGMHCSADVESRDVARDAERGGNGVPDMDKLLARPGRRAPATPGAILPPGLHGRADRRGSRGIAADREQADNVGARQAEVYYDQAWI